MEPNRIQASWPHIERKLKATYKQVPASLWKDTEGRHDFIVRLIRDTYTAGRSELSVEAEVRDLLNQWLAEAENLG